MDGNNLIARERKDNIHSCAPISTSAANANRKKKRLNQSIVETTIGTAGLARPKHKKLIDPLQLKNVFVPYL
jgi:hypothetical protein